MFLGLTSLVRLLSGLDLHWHVGLFLAWLLQHLLLLTLVQGQFSTTGIWKKIFWWNFSAQKFNNLVYVCMYAPSCIQKRKFCGPMSHVNTVRLLKLKSTSSDKIGCGDDVPFGWPAVFAIPSCFHCCLTADFISYQNVFVLLCRWYLDKFEDYPKSRRALIPFVLWRPNERTRHKTRKERNP